MIEIYDLEKIYRLRTVKSEIARNKDEANKLAKSIGYPVALKIDSPDVLHKSDIGGVYLNLANKTEVENAYENIMESVKSNFPFAKINGISVQEMIPDGFELIIGYTNDMVFGPTVMLGMGGFFTEAFKDITFRALPATKEDAVSMIFDLKYSKQLLEGFRNIRKVPTDIISDVILKTAKLAEDCKDKIESFDINPAIFYGNDYRIVDFKYIELKDKRNPLNDKPDTTDLNLFFNADSIALVGATINPDRIGAIILDNLLSNGYKGKIYPINPKYDAVRDLKAYKNINDINDKVELVVITISLEEVPNILHQCKIKDVRNVVIISAGGKEIGNDKIESEIKKLASEYAIRIIGCNCIGIYDSKTKVDTIFQPYSNMQRPKSGSISIMTQSGTVGICSLELLAEYGVSKLASYGNRIDVDEGDLIQYFGKDKDTRVIAVYIEGLYNGVKFFKAAKEVTKDKPLIVYKANRSIQSSKAAVSHTGFLSGTHNIISGIMRQAKTIQVDSFESLIASAKSLSFYDRVKSKNTLIVTNGAGVTIQAIDRIAEKGKLLMAALSESSILKLKQNLPSHFVIGNPVDLTGTATDEHFDMVLETVVNDPGIDIIMLYIVFQCKPVTEVLTDIVKKWADIKPVIFCSIGGEYTERMVRTLFKKGIPVFNTLESWVSAAEALVPF